ncbi:hypothetical protein BDP27DRAFT_1375489 [Rhodocollybia butyracea]|uniref:Uncharacterized protein n=1 Tax=Rhodocollybia butyracea TaxID=206335 RepID=A0A9P5TW79_9AGAR|nr:hypothetical protein BDP27DRAFT_1375489 [Rhodocollybia butyracea]
MEDLCTRKTYTQASTGCSPSSDVDSASNNSMSFFLSQDLFLIHPDGSDDSDSTGNWPKGRTQLQVTREGRILELESVENEGKSKTFTMKVLTSDGYSPLRIWSSIKQGGRRKRKFNRGMGDKSFEKLGFHTYGQKKLLDLTSRKEAVRVRLPIEFTKSPSKDLSAQEEAMPVSLVHVRVGVNIRA